MKTICPFLPLLLLCIAADVVRAQPSIPEITKGGGRVTLRIADPPWLLNPVRTKNEASTEITSYIFETLTVDDPVTLRPIPWIASELPRVSADHRSYLVPLRRNVRFSDGTPVTGHDFICYLKAAKNPYSKEVAYLRSHLSKIARAELVGGDPYRLRIVMTEPDVHGDRLIGKLVALPRHIWDHDRLSERITWKELESPPDRGDPDLLALAERVAQRERGNDPRYVIGSGPYMLAGNPPHWTEFTLVRNERYWNRAHPLGKANPEHLVWRVIRNSDSAIAALKSGLVDFTWVSEAEYLREQKSFAANGLAGVVYDEPLYLHVGYNQRNPILADRRVRQAIAHAVDREQIIATAFHGLARPLVSPIHAARPEFDSTLAPIRFDLAESRRLLAEAGWSDTDGDSILDREIDGRHRSFRVRLLFDKEVPQAGTITWMIVDTLRQLGVEVLVSATDHSRVLDRRRDGKFDIYISTWPMGLNEWDLSALFHSSSISPEGWNSVAFSNPEVDSLIGEIRRTFDFDRRIPLYRRMQQILHYEQPYTFLAGTSRFAIYRDHLKPLRVYPIPSAYRLGEWEGR